MTLTDLPPDVRHWLRRLGWALGRIPAPERQELLDEVSAHMIERVQSGQPTQDILAGFGAPEDYARGFLDDYELSGALGSQRSGAMVVAVGRRIHRSLVALAAFVLVAMLTAVAAAIVLTAIVKVLDPAHAGVWIGAAGFFAGVIDDPARAHELLGVWIFPLAALSVVLAWLFGRIVLLWALGTMSRGRSASAGEATR